MLAAAVAAGSAALIPHGVEAQQADQAETHSLYQRIGGYDFIARFVDTAFPRVASHPELRRFFQGHAKDSQMRQRQLIVDLLCRGMGGPCLYNGRPMTTVHEGLGITDADWRTFITVITSTVDELRVPAAERRDFLAVFERLRATVVVE
jgi:hemoglobin